MEGDFLVIHFPSSVFKSVCFSFKCNTTSEERKGERKGDERKGKREKGKGKREKGNGKREKVKR